MNNQTLEHVTLSTVLRTLRVYYVYALVSATLRKFDSRLVSITLAPRWWRFVA